MRRFKLFRVFFMFIFIMIDKRRRIKWI